MPVFSRRTALIDGMLLLLLTLCGTGLLLWSEQVSAAMAQAVRLCVQVLLPSLFPFFILSALLTGSGMTQRAAPRLEPLTRAIFGLPGSCAAAILLGAVGGYPVGAKTVADLYRQGACRREEASKALRFCNNAGPAFLIGAVGSGLLRDKSMGILLFGLHLLSALLIGVLFSENKTTVMPSGFTANLSAKKVFLPVFLQTVTGALTTFLNVCAFVLFFSVFMSLLLHLPVLNRLSPLLKGILCGSLELTSGTALLASAVLSRRTLLSALSFLCGWGGFSVQLQTIHILQEAGLPCRDYLGFKLLHGLLAAVLAFVLCR